MGLGLAMWSRMLRMSLGLLSRLVSGGLLGEVSSVDIESYYVSVSRPHLDRKTFIACLKCQIKDKMQFRSMLRTGRQCKSDTMLGIQL